ALGQSRSHQGSGALQSAVHGGYTVVEQARRLLRGPSERIAKDKDCPLPWRKVLDCSQVGKLDGFPRDRQRVWLCVAGDDLVEQPIRIGLEPFHSIRLLGLRTVE